MRARRITAALRAGKFIRRNPLSSALAGALVLALVVGAAGFAWQAQQARQQARRAEAVKVFLMSIFRGADPRLPGARPSGQTPAKVLVDAAVQRIDSSFKDDPLLRIELLRAAADIARELGEDSDYQRLLQRHVALVHAQLGPGHPLALAAPVEAGTQAYQRGDMAGCRAAQALADATLARAGQAGGEQRAHWWLNQANCHRDQHALAAQRMQWLGQAVAWFGQHQHGGRGHVTALIDLGAELISQNRFAEGELHTLQAQALAERADERNEAELQTLTNNLGLLYQQQGRLAESAAQFARAVAVAERTTGLRHRSAWAHRAKHARTLHLVGERARAQVLFEALMRDLPPIGADETEADLAREDFGERLAAEGRPADALPLLRAALQGHRQRSQFEFALRRVTRHLGDACARAGDHAAARGHLHDALRSYEAHSAPGEQPLLAARERWVRFLLEHGIAAEAAHARAEFERVVREADNPRWAHVALAQAGLARLALAAADLHAADRQSAAALATWGGVEGFRDVRMAAYLWRVRAAVLARLGQPDAAQALRQQAQAQAANTDDPGSPTLTVDGFLGL